MINAVSIINFLLFIWFNTDAFTVYFKHLAFLKIKEYKDYIKINPRINYPNWIFLQTPNFLTKLLSCKPCLCFFFCLFSHIYFNYDFFGFIQTYLISYISYRTLDKYVY